LKIKNKKYLDKIDFLYIRDILRNNYGKKIFCFGGGTAAEILTEKTDQEIQIEKFLDNNSLLYGKKINGIEITSPDILLKEDKGEFIVLILSRHICHISNQLDSYGLESGKDYYDIYTKFSPYFIIKKQEALMDRFKKFIENIPDGVLDEKPVLHNNKVGIVYSCQMYANYTSYSLAMALLLRYYGYKVSLIIDTMPSFGSYCIAEGIEEIIKGWIDEIIDKIHSKSSDIEILYIDQEGKQELNDVDKKAVIENSMSTLKWYDAQREYVFLPKEERRKNIAENILTNALMNIKGFFNVHKFETINIIGGIVNHRGMYLYYGKKSGIRVSTYDNWFFSYSQPSSGKMLYCTDGASAQMEDVSKVINGNYFNPEEKKEILKLAKESFKKRKKAIIGDGGDIYQISRYKEDINPYDVIIPLNVNYDAAALQREKVFPSYIEWLEQTLEFIMENTDASVMVREHPAQNLEIQCIFPDLLEEIPAISKYKERIFLAKAAEDINTYQYLEQCKLVLPYTSTVGIEAVILRKNVITHTNVYYNDIDIVFNVESKKEYFDAILYYLRHTELPDNINVDNAYLAYFYMLNASLECEYHIYNTSWMEMSLEGLSRLSGVKIVVDAVGSGIPVIYSSIKYMLLNFNYSD